MSDLSTDFKTMVEIFDRSVRLYGEKPLFGTKRQGRWDWMSYATFGDLVHRVRAGLAGLELGRGDKVSIIADNRAEWAITCYAGAGLSVALVPMYEAQSSKEWEFILRDSEAKCVVVANRGILEKTLPFLQSIPSLKNIVLLDGEKKKEDGPFVHLFSDLAKSEPTTPVVTPDPSDMLGLIYTSGTTGNPKGVILSHSNVAQNVTAMHHLFPFAEADRSLSFLPWAHSFGQVVELHGLFSAGASIGICESVNKILDNLTEVQPTLLFSVPRIFNRIYMSVQKQIASKPKAIQQMVKLGLKGAANKRDHKPVSFLEHAALVASEKLVFKKVRAKFGGRLKYAFSGGAAISREVAEFIDGIGITVYEGYGLTETSPIATGNSPNKGRKIGSVGRAIPGVSIVIDSKATDGKRNDRGFEEGEILVYGHNVMQGYFKRDEENKAVFVDAVDDRGRGFRTGDMGFVDADGYLYITGRIKEQYKLENGKYVVPTPLEEQLKLSPFILNVMVYGDNKPYNVALVVVSIDAVKSWGTEENIALPVDADAILREPRVVEKLRKEVKALGDAFKGFEEIRDIALIDEDFSAENGLLTPSLKVKRRAVLEKYGPLLEALYKKKS